MRFGISVLAWLILFLPAAVFGEQSGDHPAHQGYQMASNRDGVVMNENLETLPHDCASVSRDHAITIHAGRKYAEDEAGMIFGMSQHEVRVQPCSRLEVTFVNEDSVRHQWMVHGLPKYLYPAGMFHIEVSGGHSMTGTFIVPGDNHTYLIHCDIAQHMEKGMRGQLKVGSGSGDLWGVAGVSDQFYRSDYLPKHIFLLALLVLIFSFLLSLRLAKKL